MSTPARPRLALPPPQSARLALEEALRGELIMFTTGHRDYAGSAGARSELLDARRGFSDKELRSAFDGAFAAVAQSDLVQVAVRAHRRNGAADFADFVENGFKDGSTRRMYESILFYGTPTAPWEQPSMLSERKPPSTQNVEFTYIESIWFSGPEALENDFTTLLDLGGRLVDDAGPRLPQWGGIARDQGHRQISPPQFSMTDLAMGDTSMVGSAALSYSAVELPGAFDFLSRRGALLTADEGTAQFPPGVPEIAGLCGVVVPAVSHTGWALQQLGSDTSRVLARPGGGFVFLEDVGNDYPGAPDHVSLVTTGEPGQTSPLTAISSGASQHYSVSGDGRWLLQSCTVNVLVDLVLGTRLMFTPEIRTEFAFWPADSPSSLFGLQYRGEECIAIRCRLDNGSVEDLGLVTLEGGGSPQPWTVVEPVMNPAGKNALVGWRGADERLRGTGMRLARLDLATLSVSQINETYFNGEDSLVRRCSNWAFAAPQSPGPACALSDQLMSQHFDVFPYAGSLTPDLDHYRTWAILAGRACMELGPARMHSLMPLWLRYVEAATTEGANPEVLQWVTGFGERSAELGKEFAAPSLGIHYLQTVADAIEAIRKGSRIDWDALQSGKMPLQAKS